MRNLVLAALVGVGVLILPGIVAAVPQPDMEATLASLATARNQIILADQHRDHGGHAALATKLIDQAIFEVKEGIRYRNEHPRPGD